MFVMVFCCVLNEQKAMSRNYYTNSEEGLRSVYERCKCSECKYAVDRKENNQPPRGHGKGPVRVSRVATGLGLLSFC